MYEDLIQKLQELIKIPASTQVQYSYQEATDTSEYIQIQLTASSPNDDTVTPFTNLWEEIFGCEYKQHIKYFQDRNDTNVHIIRLFALHQANSKLREKFYLEQLCLMVPKPHYPPDTIVIQQDKIIARKLASWTATYSLSQNSVTFLWNSTDPDNCMFVNAFAKFLFDNLRETTLTLRHTVRGPELTIQLEDELKLLLSGKQGWKALIQSFHEKIQIFIAQGQELSDSRELEPPKKGKCSIQ